MRAVVLSRLGGPDELVLAEVPDPVPGPGQVVIAVDMASITFVETQVRSGHPPHPSMTPDLPVILGNGVGGTVASTGDSLTGDSLTGDSLTGDSIPGGSLPGGRFISTTGGSGGYAERVAVNRADLIAIPDGTSTADAVALLADGRTAMALMSGAAVKPGDVVLVEAAAGGVGSLLVQLAVGAGATVVAAAGATAKLELAAGLGAQYVVDYSEPDWADRVREMPADVVFDGVGGAVGEAAFTLLRDGGRMCTYGMASGQFAQISDAAATARGVSLIRGAPVTPERMRELTSAALTAAAAGRMRPVIGQTFPLARAAAAHAAIEARKTTGKTLLTTA
jgi:NADPH:quinone reductase